MILEFTQPFGNWKVGEITDTISEGTGRALIAEGTAKESTEGAQLRALVKAESERTRTETLELTRSLLQGNKTTSIGPPDGGGGVNFDAISTGTPAAEQDKGHLSDALRCIFIAGSKDAPAELATYCKDRLRGVYAEEQIEYKLNGQSGKFDSIVTRHLPGGGKEVITRTGTDSLGGGATYGFTLKPTYLGDLYRVASERAAFASRCRRIPITQGLEVKYPALGQYSAPTVVNGIPQAAVFAGISLQFKGETDARVESDANAEEIDFKAVDLTGATSYSRDYIVDNFIAMDSVVTGLFGQAMAWIEDWCTIRGDGLGKPQGFFNSAALILGGPNSNARSNANKVASEDLGWMISHLMEQCDSPMWLAHRSTIPQLFILNNAAGTPVFQPNASIVQSDPLSIMNSSSGGMNPITSGMLLGIPIRFTEKVPQLGTPGDISLVDGSFYGLAERAGLEVALSEHFYFMTDKIVYKFKKRFDGRSLVRAPITDASNISTPASGWQTSPYISLK